MLQNLFTQVRNMLQRGLRSLLLGTSWRRLPEDIVKKITLVIVYIGSHDRPSVVHTYWVKKLTYLPLQLSLIDILNI